MSLPVGIDLGTTNSLIAVFRDGRPELLANALGSVMTPSAVAVQDGALLIGQPAWDYGLSHAKNVATSFKRLMGTGQHVTVGGRAMTAIELSSLVLRKLKTDAEAVLGTQITEAVVTVPAYFNQVQRQATITACRLADIKPLGLINEPTAAALAYGLQDRDGESQFLVFDLGGGTFDVTVLEHFDGVMEVKASSGDAHLGGDDFTDVMFSLLLDRLELTEKDLKPAARNRLRYFAEQAKRKMSSGGSFVFTFELEGKTHSLDLSIDAFEAAAAPLLRRLRAPLHRCLYDADGALRDIDRVILVGGATRMPFVKQLAAREARLFPEASINPDHVVALGAAVQAALIKEDRALGDVVMTDVSPFSIGIESSHESGKRRIRGIFSPIIERNAPLPASRVGRFYAVHDDQRFMNIAVYQGESARVENNVLLAEFTVPLPQSNKESGRAYVDVRITQDISGLVEVLVKVCDTDIEKRVSIKTNDIDITDAEIARQLKALDYLKIHPLEDEANKAILNRLDRLFQMATGDDRDYVRGLYDDFQVVLERQAPKEIEIARKRLIEILNSIDSFYVS